MTILLNHGAALDHVNAYDRTVVWHAVENGNMNILQYLLSLGAPIGSESLFLAARSGNVDGLRLLVQHGFINLDVVDRNGSTAVDLAVQSRSLKTTEYLLSLGAPIGKTCFLQAAEYCDVDMLLVLVQHGAILDCVDKWGNTAVEGAIRNQKVKNVEYLLSLGCPIGKNAVVLVLDLFRTQMYYDPRGPSTMDMLTLLVERRAILDGVNERGETAVEMAIKNRHEQTAEYLLRSGAPSGRNALFYALDLFWRDDPEKVEFFRFLLLHNLALIDESRNGETIREIAVRKRLLSIVELIDAMRQ